MLHIEQRFFKTAASCDNLNVLPPRHKCKGEWELMAGVISCF